MEKNLLIFTTFKRNYIWIKFFFKTKCRIIIFYLTTGNCYSYFKFFDILEIFLAAVFLLTAPDLATCIRID
jgi:hypothetical protein